MSASRRWFFMRYTMFDKPITPRQRALIEDMNEFCDEKFNFNKTPTLKAAQQYISRNIEEFKLKTLDNWHLENGYF